MPSLFTFGAPPPAPLPDDLSDQPDWVQANPARIERALARALGRPAGGWYAVDAVDAITRAPRAYTIAGRALILWRSAEGRLLAAPEACPHMGASLACARTRGDAVICPWHGLELGPRPHGRWRPLVAHDDGVLAWVRLEGEEAPSDAPILAPRPEGFVAGVIRMEAACEPADILANRLDPWHGAHFHPHSFARLRVLEEDEDVLRVRVAYRVVGPLAVEVDATFHCPDRRTIVMTIVGGEGVGSVVETHATPIEGGRTAVIEATLATSERRGFAVARATARLWRGMITRRATRLWVEDIAYAERRYALRRGEPVRLRTIQGG
ncbi:MAG: Rieske 2Fe-2S domain-containing protein [Myxococcales bacterium]|nr:Rieske 2Fe-2S domain-containing protein [Myxococcales bacterium]